MSKQPPYNDDIERDLLGMFLDFPDYQDRIIGAIPTEKLFYSQRHQRIFQTFYKCYVDHGNVDYSLIRSYSQNGDHNYIYSLLNRQPSGEIFQAKISQLEQLFKLRKIFNILVDTAKKLNNFSNPDELKNFMECELANLEPEQSNLLQLNDIIDTYGSQEAYEQMITSIMKIGIHKIDDNIIVKKGDLVILAGRPSSGKTAFCLHIAKESAKRGKKVGIFSLEMRGEYLLKRLAFSESNLQGCSGYLEGCKKLYDLPIWVDDCSQYDLIKLKEKSKVLLKKYSIDMIMIDYLGLLDPPRSESRNIEVTKISKTLKSIAKEFGIPFIVLSQLSRECEKRKNKKPQMSDLRDSGSIEQDADIILFCYRPWEYGINPSTEKNKIEKDQFGYYFELITGKQRDGIRPIFKLRYDPSRNNFYDWDLKHDEN